MRTRLVVGSLRPSLHVLVALSMVVALVGMAAVGAQAASHSLDLAPAASTPGVGQDQTMTATLTGFPNPGTRERVSFEVYRDDTGDGVYSGPRPGSVVVASTTGAVKTATMTYSQSDGEFDDIVVACVAPRAAFGPVTRTTNCRVADTAPSPWPVAFAAWPAVGVHPHDISTVTWGSTGQVLYYTDGTQGTDRVLAGLQDMLADSSIDSLTVASSRQDVIDRLPDGPEVVVYFNQNNNLPDASATALAGWADDGNRLIVADWSAHPTLLAAMDAAATGNTNQTAATFTDFALAAGVSQPMPLTDPGWSIFSRGLAPVAGGSSVCTFANAESCLVRGNAGRTAAVGFLNDTMADADGRAFTRNLVTSVLGS